MKLDSRLSSVLHLLLHMDAVPAPISSETLAGFLRTNPVVVRRMLGQLRKAGLVRSGKGHGGGWQLARELGAISLLDVYTALGSPPIFALGNRSSAPRCLVEQAVNASLGGAMAEAEALLMGRLRSVSLAGLAEDFRVRMKQHPQAAIGDHRHD